MTWRPMAAAAGNIQDVYFFLSYAHSVPIAMPNQSDSDYWVRRFFDDLGTAVAARVGQSDPAAVGFFDGLLEPRGDFRRDLTEALSYAHVFVPLYSPGYFKNAWALGELASFQARLDRLGGARGKRHIVPVVWIPLPPWETRTEIDEALGLVEKSQDYADNGLRALCKLGAYRDSYRELVGALAERIVTVVRQSPLPQSAAGPLIMQKVPAQNNALIVSTVSSATDPHAWRPFAEEHTLPIVDYLVATAQRLGLPTQVSELDDARRQAASQPCILLIESGSDPRRVEAAVDGLPRWVLPLVVVPGERGSVDIAATTGILHNTEFAEVDAVYGVDEFELNAPLLVTEARKQFLRYGPVVTSSGATTPRPSLRTNVDGREG